MMDLQHTHNQQVHPHWHKQNYPFHRAIWTECAELLDHYGWKWWKLQEPDLVQVKLEIVVSESMVDQIVGTITQTAQTGKIGDGKIFVLDVEQAIRVRTGETNEDAL